LICPFITRAKLDRRLKSKILTTLPRLDRPQADNPQRRVRVYSVEKLTLLPAANSPANAHTIDSL